MEVRSPVVVVPVPVKAMYMPYVQFRPLTARVLPPSWNPADRQVTGFEKVLPPFPNVTGRIVRYEDVVGRDGRVAAVVKADGSEGELRARRPTPQRKRRRWQQVPLLAPRF